MSASLCQTWPRPEESVVHPWSHEAEPHALSVLWDSQFLNYDNYFVRKKAGCEDKKLMHCKPLTQILSFCIKPLKKKASQHISSTLAVFLCRHRFLIMQSFLFSEHISLCKLLPDSTLPSAYLALQAVHSLHSSWEGWPNKLHGSRGEGVSWTRYALACSTCSAGYF